MNTWVLSRLDTHTREAGNQLPALVYIFTIENSVAVMAMNGCKALAHMQVRLGIELVRMACCSRLPMR